MKILHTPGPWIHDNNGLIYGQASDDDDEAPFVCDVINDSAMQALGILSPTEEANAKIIAAAPHMIDEHIKINDLICKHMAAVEAGEYSYALIVDILIEIQNNSRNAILKSGGSHEQA